MDRELLRRIDEDPEVRRRGRSAFIRAAVEMYLQAKAKRELDEQILRAYGGQEDAMVDEVAELIADQLWPNP